MSLKEVIIEIADEMESLAKRGDPWFTAELALSFVRQLRRAVKAAGDDKPTVDTSAFLAMGTQLENKAKAIIDRQRERQAEDSIVTGDCMAFCAGGPMDGTYVPINPAMPIGAYLRLGAERYQLGSNKTLHHSSDVSG